VIRNLLRNFEFAAVLQVAVMPVARKVWLPICVSMPGGGRAALDDAVGVLLPGRFPAENAGVSGRRLEEWLIRIAGRLCRLKPYLRPAVSP
jgi:hypothetical protein